MYSRIYRKLRLLKAGGLETREHVHELERTQWLSREELEVMQFEKLKKVVSYAYENVPFYRKKYREAGIHPEEIKSLDDIQALPYLTRDEVNKNLDKLVSPEFLGQVQKGSTGGSTGQPMRFYVDDSFWWWNAALEFRGRGWYGVHEGDKMAWIWGAPQEISEWNYRIELKARIMRHRYLNSFGMSESNMQEFASMLVRWQPVMFRAYVSAITLFAKFIREQGISGIRPRLIEITAEKLTESQRKYLEDTFQCPIANCYSARELATIAYQCDMGGLHVCETRHLETVADDNNVSPGEIGEVVITSLTQYAMPLIRYKIDDLAIFEKDHCSCGRGLPILREIVGREIDTLVTADGELVFGAFFLRLFRLRPEVIRFQVYQPDRQHLEVRLVCDRNVDSAWFEDIRIEIQARFGLSTQVSFELVDSIELSPAGKHHFITSEIKPDIPV